MKFSIYSNGKKIDDKVPVNTDLTESVSVFESLRTYRGKIFQIEQHLARFMESAKTAGRDKGLERGALEKELRLALETFKKENPKAREADLFIRLTLLPESFRTGSSKWPVYVLIGERKHPPAIYKTGVRLRTSPVRRSLANASPPQAKTSAYQNAVLATLEPAEGAYEWIFLDQQGYVTEVRIGNLFIVKDEELITPPTMGILNGVTRRFVIESAVRLEIPVREIPLTRHEIFTADEAFLTNTSWEILPVRELDGRRTGGKIPGPLTLKLQKLFKERVQENL